MFSGQTVKSANVRRRACVLWCVCVSVYVCERERERDSNAIPTLGSVLQSALLRESSFVPQIGALHTALL